MKSVGEGEHRAKLTSVGAEGTGRRQGPKGLPYANRSKRRWVVERVFAWLHNSWRLVTRWDRHLENFVAMLQLGCMRILLNRS